MCIHLFPPLSFYFFPYWYYLSKSSIQGSDKKLRNLIYGSNPSIRVFQVSLLNWGTLPPPMGWVSLHKVKDDVYLKPGAWRRCSRSLSHDSWSVKRCMILGWHLGLSRLLRASCSSPAWPRVTWVIGALKVVWPEGEWEGIVAGMVTVGEGRDVYGDEIRVIKGIVTDVVVWEDSVVGMLTEGGGRDLCSDEGKGWVRGGVIGIVTAIENHNGYCD